LEKRTTGMEVKNINLQTCAGISYVEGNVLFRNTWEKQKRDVELKRTLVSRETSSAPTAGKDPLMVRRSPLKKRVGQPRQGGLSNGRASEVTKEFFGAKKGGGSGLGKGQSGKASKKIICFSGKPNYKIYYPQKFDWAGKRYSVHLGV